MPFLPIYDNNPRVHILRPYVTWSLIALNVLVFVWQTSGGDAGFQESVYRFGFIPVVFGGGAMLPPELQAPPSFLTLFTSQFLHGDTFHLAFNMLFLWVFGDNIEDALGRLRFIVFYLLSGVLAALAHFVFDFGSEIPVVGASGAISGVLGAYLLLYPRAWVMTPVLFLPLMLPAGLMLILWFGSQLLNVFEADAASNVAWWAHIGGFLAGLALVVPMKRRTVPLFGGQRPPRNLRIERGVVRRPKAAQRAPQPGTRTAKTERRQEPEDPKGPWQGQGPWDEASAAKRKPASGRTSGGRTSGGRTAGRKGPWG